MGALAMIYGFNPMRIPAHRVGALVLLAAVIVIVTALGFEYLGGYAACPLCLEQRYAYYVAIPLLLLALVLLSADHISVAALVFIGVAVIFLANAGLGLYHAGAEWKFWPGPDTCAAAGPLTAPVGGLLKDLATTRVVRCDEAAWRFLGLSFAGWNVVASLLLAAGGVLAAVSSRRR